MMNTSLPEEARSEILLDLTYFITPYPTCYLDAGASIINYYNNQSYDEFIYFGIPSIFKFNSYRTGPGGGELVWESFYNQGYTSYCGRTIRQYLPQPETKHMTADDNFIFFHTEKEAFTFVKKLLSIDIPVIIEIGLDRPHYHILKGYNLTHVYLPPYTLNHDEFLENGTPLYHQHAAKTTFTEIMNNQDFLSIWAAQGHTFYWFEKTKASKMISEIDDLNKEGSKTAASNILLFVNKMQDNIDIFSSFTSYGDGAIVTAALSRYLSDQNQTELSENYSLISNTYNELARNTSESINSYSLNKMSQLSDLYQAVANQWE